MLSGTYLLWQNHPSSSSSSSSPSTPVINYLTAAYCDMSNPPGAPGLQTTLGPVRVGRSRRIAFAFSDSGSVSAGNVSFSTLDYQARS